MFKYWDKIRIPLLVIAGILILISFLFPIWKIYLNANMYPNDIGMAIYAYKPGDPPDVKEMDGGLTELNILNHYIGMRPIKTDLLVFKLLPALFSLIAILLIVSAFWRKKGLLIGTALLFTLTSIYGWVTFVYTLYVFGHDLKSEAAIKVPPFMPGIYGENRLAQFTTWSYFDWGLYLPVISFVLCWLVLFLDRLKKNRDSRLIPEKGEKI